MSRLFVRRPALIAGAVTLLLLSAAAGRSLAARGQVAPQPATADVVATLVGAPWRIVEVSGKRAPADARVTFTGATVSGSAGCNRFFAPLVAGSATRIGQIQSTRMLCAGRMDSERAVIEALSRVRLAVRVGDSLELRDGDGTAVLRLIQ